MRILVLSHISELVGGAEKSLLDVFDLWAKNKKNKPEFILRIPVGTLGKALKERNWKYYELDYTFWSESTPPKREERIKQAARKNTRAVVEIERIIKKIKPDLVITNSVVCPWAALAAYNQKVPHVWFVREYGDLDHGRVYEIGREKTLQDVGNLSSLVVANSQTLKKHLEKYIDNKKLIVLYNPFDIKRLNRLAEERVKNPYRYKDSLKLVVTGSMTPSKGQLDIVKALAQLNDEGIKTELCIIGSNGPKDYEDKIEKVIKDNNLKDRVHMVGHQKNPLAFVSLADVGIMASRMEAFGRVTFEYMAVGKPVVGTDAGGTTEMIASGQNGYLYKRGDVKDLANGLKQYAKDRKLIRKHGDISAKKAQEMMSGEFNAQKLFKKVEDILAEDQPEKSQPINYMNKLVGYEEMINENRVKNAQKTFVRKIRSRAGKTYRLTRQTAKKVLKNKNYDRK